MRTVRRGIRHAGPAISGAQRMYQRAVAAWAGDVLRSPICLKWSPPDPVDDFRDRQWGRMYAGSVLDD